MSERSRNILIRVTAVTAVLALSYIIFLNRQIMVQLAGYGYFGILVISALTNATLFLPTPGLALVFALGGSLNFWLVGSFAALGSAIGELSGYIAGYSGQPIIGRMDLYERIKPYIEKHGAVIVFILSALPNPFLDAAGIAAGVMKIPVHKFMFWTFLGKLVKMTIVAYFGYRSIDWIEQYL